MHAKFNDDECGGWDDDSNMEGFWDEIGREAWKEWIKDEKKKRNKDKVIDMEKEESSE